MSIIDTAPWVEFFGRLHPMVLHLPIGLWIGVGEILSRHRSRRLGRRLLRGLQFTLVVVEQREEEEV